MADAYLIDVDLANLAKGEGRSFCNAEVAEFLRSLGMIEQGEKWVVEEIQLRGLQKDEYRIVEQLT